MTQQNGERLQKALSRAGISSRRGGEELIMAGRVKVNGKIVTELGTKIDPATDKVTVDDEPVSVKVSATPQKVYIMLNKPAGYLSTVSDPQGRPTIMDLLDTEKLGRLYPVGRLDADTEGLLILTNDGAFANALTHPRFGVEKEYVALLDGIIAMKDIERLRRGVAIPVEDSETGERVEQVTKPAKVDLIRHEGSNSLVRFILKEGKKRQIRLMADAVDHPVIELRRVRQGPVKLGTLASGKFRNLSKDEVKELEEASKPGAAPAETPVAPNTQARSQAHSQTHSAAPASRTRQEPAAPGGRVAPFRAPGTGTGAGRSGQFRRSGERRFEQDSFNRGDNRRNAAPGADRGSRSGPPRFERDDSANPTRRTPGNPRFERDESAPGPYRGQRSGPPRFERDETSAPPRRTFDRPRREGGNDFERGQEQGRDRDRDRDRGRPVGNFDRDRDRGKPAAGADRGAPPRRNFRQDAESGGEGAKPFRSGPGRSPTGNGPSRDRNNDSPAGNRNSGPGGRRFPPGNKPGSGSGPTSNRPFRPNPGGFVPAAERSAPTPGRGRPPARPNQSAPEAPNRGSRGPARGRPGGPRNFGGGRRGRDE
jgi:pseudouridine synthase